MMTPRPKRIGATDIGAVCALTDDYFSECSRWKNASDVWLWIVHGVGIKSSGIMERGLRVEPKLREMFRQHIGPVSDSVPVVKSTAFEYASCSPDGIALLDGEDVLVEFKTQTLYSKAVWSKDSVDGDTVPLRYSLQAQWMMSLLELKRTIFMVSFGVDKKTPDGTMIWIPSHTETYSIDFNPTDEVLMHNHALSFWDSYCKPRKPPIQDSTPLKPVNNRRKFAAILKGETNESVSAVAENF